MAEYNNIFEIIEKSNNNKLRQYFYDKPKNIISIWDSRSKNQDKVILKTLWTYNLLKDAFDKFFEHWKTFFKNWNKNSKWAPLPHTQMSQEDKQFYWYDLSKIDYEKINSLNKEELRFIIENLINVSRNTVRLVDNVSVNVHWLKFSKKNKKIRNAKIIQDKLLKNAYLKNNWNKLSPEEFKIQSQYLNERQKILKQDFQSWMIDELRLKNIDIPDIINLKTKEEMEVNLTKNIYKFI